MVFRIKQLLDWQQLSPTQFADRIGVGRPVVSHILSERNKPSLEVVQRIIAAFPELSLPWLLSGSGAMLTDEATEASTHLAAASLSPSPVSDTPAPALPSPTEPTLTASLAPSSADVPLRASAAVALPPAPVPVTIPPLAAPSAPPARFRASKPTLPLPPATRAVATAPAATLSSPTGTSAPSSSVQAEAATPASPVAAAGLTILPTAENSPSLLAEQLAPPLAADAAALAASLAKPGKAIRHIVIFYRDGSFADYQPE